MNRVLVVVLSLLAQAEATAGGPSVELIREQADAAVTAVTGEATPGLAAAIVRDGEVVWGRYLGLADLDHGLAVDSRSRFYLGSLTKPLIAAATLTLAQEGAFALEDSLDRWWPDLPSWAERVTVRHLLTMTSGVRDYLKLRDLAGEPEFGPFDNDSALEMLHRQRGLAFEPGSRYRYSNSNYVLLAEIIARVSGETVQAAVHGRVLEPLGMKSALLESDHRQVIEHRVTSYRLGGDGTWHRYLKIFSSLGDGGGWATLVDLLALDRWIAGGEGLAPGVLATMLEPAELADGSHGDYGAGLLVRPWRGLSAIEHGGFMLGFQHLYIRLPDHDVGVVLLTNNHEVEPFALRDKLLEIALGNDSPAPPEADAPTDTEQRAGAREFDPESPLPSGAAGCYWNDEAPVGIEISRRGEDLVMRPTSFRELPLARTGRLLFMVGGMQVRFRLGTDNAVESLELLSDDFGLLPFDRAPAERCRARE